MNDSADGGARETGPWDEREAQRLRVGLWMMTRERPIPAVRQLIDKFWKELAA